MLNKKGLAVHWFMMIGYILGIMAFLTMLSYLVINSIALSADTYHLEYYLLFNRAVYSKDSVFYYDASIDRVYPGVIDVEKFYDETLNNLFGENEDFGVKLSIGDENKYDIFYNKNIYETGEYVFELENSVYGGLRYSFPITVKDGGNDILLIGLMYKK